MRKAAGEKGSKEKKKMKERKQRIEDEKKKDGR